MSKTKNTDIYLALGHLRRENQAEIGGSFSFKKWFSENIADNEYINTTANDLKNLVKKGNLETSKVYRIADFRSIYDRPDYEEVGGNIVPKDANNIQTIKGDIEPIFVQALSTSQLSPIAYSELHPDDILHYQLEYNTPINNTPTKGFIYYRENTTNNVKTSFDFRNITFKRYDHSDGKGYVYYWDDGSNDFELFNAIDIDQTFKADLTLTNFIVLDFTGFDLPNFVFKEFVFDVQGNTILNSTFEDSVEAVKNSSLLSSNFEEINMCDNMFIINSYVKKITQISSFNIIDSDLDVSLSSTTGNFNSLNNVIISETNSFKNNRINAQIDNKTITESGYLELFNEDIYCEIYSKPNGDIFYRFTNNLNVIVLLPIL